MAGHSRPKDGVASLAYVPAIHALLRRQDVDARHKAGHDSGAWCGLGEARELRKAGKRYGADASAFFFAAA